MDSIAQEDVGANSRAPGSVIMAGPYIVQSKKEYAAAYSYVARSPESFVSSKYCITCDKKQYFLGIIICWE